jgi:hypothetical protein
VYLQPVCLKSVAAMKERSQVPSKVSQLYVGTRTMSSTQATDKQSPYYFDQYDFERLGKVTPAAANRVNRNASGSYCFDRNSFEAQIFWCTGSASVMQ